MAKRSVNASNQPVSKNSEDKLNDDESEEDRRRGTVTVVQRTRVQPHSLIMAITIRGVPKTSPSVRDVLSSKETPDGSPRYGLFASDLKKERRAWAKLAFLVSPSIPLAIELMMAFN